MSDNDHKLQHFTFALIRKCNGNVIGHVARHDLDGYVIPLHDHDYYEIECGCENEAIQVLNSVEGTFSSNDIFMLRPEDRHEIHTAGKKNFIYYNIAFEEKHLDLLYENYHLELIREWKTGKDWTRRRNVSLAGVSLIRQQLHEMLLDTQRAFSMDRFLMNFFYQLEKEEKTPYFKCPLWLQETISHLEQPKWMKEGPRALEKISGYSLAHISRILKNCMACTPTDILNQIRMEYAVRKLSLTNCDIYSLVEDCGFSSPAYFFKLFHATYDCTPLQYRKNHCTQMR